MKAIGVSIPRRDSEPKVRGATRFGADQPVPGLLHARLVLANEVHALISRIGTDEASEVPGVVSVLTAAELPIVGSAPGRNYEPLAREEVIYAGQPVAMVIAETEAAAEDGAELVEVELEPLMPVLDLEAAARPGAPRALEGAGHRRRRTRSQRRPCIGVGGRGCRRGAIGQRAWNGEGRTGRRRRRARLESRRRRRHVLDEPS